MIDKIIRFVVKQPFIVIIPIAALTVFFWQHAQNIRFDTDIQALIPSGGVTGEFVEHYGEEQDSFDYLVIAVTSDDLYNLDGLQVLYDTIAAVQAIGIFAEPVSPFTFTTFERIGTRIRPALTAPDGKVPKTPEDAALMKQRLEQDPFARNLIISRDKKTLSVYFPQPVKVTDHAHYVEQITAALEPLHEYYQVHRIGSIFYALQVQGYLFEDLARLLIIALLFMIVLFYSGFKAFRAVIIPLLIVGIGTIWSIGAMSMMDYPITVITVALPPVILALGSSYAIHMLNQYFRDSTIKAENPRDAVWMVGGVKKIAKTILVAGVTTLIGFSSLLFSQIDQIQHFGFGAIAGITTCILLSLSFLPSTLALYPHPRPSSRNIVVEGTLSNIMKITGPHVVRKHRWYVLLSIVMLVLGIILYPRIEQQTDFLDYFPDKDPLIADTNFILEHFGSFHHIYLTLSAPDQKENYFLDAEVLKKVYDFETSVAAVPDVGYLASFPGYIAFMHELMTSERRIPDSRGLILTVSRIFKLASVRGIDEVGSFANDDFSEITYTLRLYDSSQNEFIYDEDLKRRLAEIQEYGQKLPDGVELSFWGWNLIFADLADILKHDQNTSLIISAAGVAVICMVFFKSIALGLVSLIPLAAGLFLTYISMVLFSIPMDMSSAMTASIAIGVGVDDAVHFLIHYRARRNESCSVEEAVIDTITVTGRPILLTSFAIIGGLVILITASFKPITFFGALISLALTGACLGTILVLPSWLLLFASLKNRSSKAIQ